MPSSGPTKEQLITTAAPQDSAEPRPPDSHGIQLVAVTSSTARELTAYRKTVSFSDAFGADKTPSYVLGKGDILEVSIWEAPPAMLFGSGLSLDGRAGSASSRATALPEQMVQSDGAINVPFVGRVQASGRAPQDIESELVRRLAHMAHQPQVLVRVMRNQSSNVTVVGEVVASTRMPLTPQAERLLDAVAAAGGVRLPVSKMTLQLTRGPKVLTMPLDSVIRDPQQNVFLRAGDVVTVAHQPLSFTVLGAAGKNEEVSFEAQGISLIQALARSGGLQDARADAGGVFLFRFEDWGALAWKGPVGQTPDGKVPVVYQLDLKDPMSFFAAQSFAVNDKDLIYVANAQAAELQKFLNIVTAIAAPVLGVINVTR